MENAALPVFLPVFLFVACVIGLVIVLLAMAHLFNPRRPGPVKSMPYESGMDPIHAARRRFGVRFYLLAIAFLVFDVELLFLYPWAVIVRPAKLAASAPGTGTEVSEAGRTPALAAATAALQQSAAGRAVARDRDLVFAGVMVFVALLTLGFIYDWRKGVFRWR